MKNVITVFTGFAVLALSAAFAQDDTTGTYTGSVERRCIITTNLGTDVPLDAVTDVDVDGFETGFTGSDKGEYRSNQDCSFDGEGSVTDQPDFEELTDEDVDCFTGNGNAPAAPEAREFNLEVTVTDNNDEVLRAGDNYEFECLVTISPLL